MQIFSLNLSKLSRKFKRTRKHPRRTREQILSSIPKRFFWSYHHRWVPQRWSKRRGKLESCAWVFFLCDSAWFNRYSKKEENIDTYEYFGESVYDYSLKSGIEDGFLTPYKVKLIKTTLSDGYTYNPDDLIQGELEKGFYKQSEFERNIFLPNYNDFIAKKNFRAYKSYG